jgi:hypothetical protein
MDELDHGRRLFLDRVELEDRLAAELAFAFRHATALGVLLLLPEEIRAGDARQQRAFGERLVNLVRLEDVIARFDDRAWVVLVHGVAPPSLRQMAERLCALFLQRPRPPATGARTVVSIGLAIAEPRCEGESAEQLLRRAWVALERARCAGGGRVKA